MIEQKSVTVNGTDYLLTQLPATKGIRVMKQLIKLVGPAAAEIFKEGDISGAVDKLVENMDAVDVEALLKELVATASKGSVAINFDNEFAGQYASLLLLVKEIVEFNFGNVFTMLGSSVS
jgi:hypothetical protein